MSIRESRYGRLVHHFLGGFLDNDLLMSSEAGLDGALSQMVALIVAPGLFYSFLAFFKYSSVPFRLHEVIIWEDELLFISLAMILIGFLSVMEWDALFPDRRDYHILTPLPVNLPLLFLAKLSAVLLLLLALFWAAANLSPAFLFTPSIVRPTDPWFAYPRSAAAHIVATFGASAFVFLLFIGVEGILLNVLSPKWFRRASVYVQLLATLVLVFSLLALPVAMSRTTEWIRGDSPWVHALPPFWFVGLYQVLTGRHGPPSPALTEIALVALAAVIAAAALAYAASYKRHLRTSLETLEPRRSGPGALARASQAALNRLVLRHPLERACFDFIRLTLMRSRIHRLLLAAWIAAGLALVLGAVTLVVFFAPSRRPTPGLLSVQFVLSFFLLCGMRFAFALPAELRANWAFQATEPCRKDRCAAGVRKAMLMLGICPVLLALLPLQAWLWGWPLAGAHLLYGGILALLLVELLLRGFDKIPFTCSYLPGKANVKVLWPVYVVSFWAYAYALAELEYHLLSSPWGLAAVCLTALAAMAALRWRRKRRFGSSFRFVFEELPDPAVRTLNLSR